MVKKKKSKCNFFFHWFPIPPCSVLAHQTQKNIDNFNSIKLLLKLNFFLVVVIKKKNIEINENQPIFALIIYCFFSTSEKFVAVFSFSQLTISTDDVLFVVFTTAQQDKNNQMKSGNQKSDKTKFFTRGFFSAVTTNLFGNNDDDGVLLIEFGKKNVIVNRNVLNNAIDTNTASDVN